MAGKKKSSHPGGVRQPPPNRSIPINAPPPAGAPVHVHNGITTSKYNIVTFLPKNLFEQFRRVANLYFLIIAILQLIPLGLSSISPITSILPLGFVLGVTAIKEGIEDIRRHKLDTQTNNEKAIIIKDGKEETVTWAQIQVGNIVKVEKDSNFPCDLILLASSDPSGTCYIETKNLDGETNYKDRQAIPETRTEVSKLSPQFISSLKGQVDCEGPNNSLYTFNGYIRMEGKEKISLGVRQILLRGSQLRNTKYIYGLVVYTGHDTKLMQNATDPPSKRSNLEVVMNRLIFTVFGFLGAVCLLSGIMAGIYQKQSFETRDYLFLELGLAPERQKPAIYGVMAFFTFVILFNTMIPISLYVSMELVKVAQALLMSTDENMHNKKADDSISHCDPHTTNLNEELGQVQFIFSDKTGTLTCNMMEFLKCSVNGEVYGNGITEIARAAAKRSGKTLPPDPPGTRKDLRPGELNFADKRLYKDLYGKGQTAESLKMFLQMLAVCHTVIPEEQKGKLVYQASSPDEFALVHAARHMGFALKTRDIDSVTILENEGRPEAKAVSTTWKILNTLEFNSTRKRMSNIVLTPDKRILLMTKGADSVIYERLRKGKDKKLAEVTQQHLNTFAEEGLRTLCFAYNELTEAEYAAWNKKYHEASTLLVGREEAIDKVAEEIEVNLTLVGASAIEDKLQEGVPNTIEVLARAGIKIWVLTGDKQETAINIGFACSLLHTEMHIIVVNDKDKDGVLKKLDDGIKVARGVIEKGRDLGFVIDGAALTYALEPECEQRTLELAKMCKSVICCRVSPIQKALVVRLVKDNLDKITLAVGDGANDVSMIQAAHLGIGIEGEEGTQAVRSSDYSVGQFRFLAPLLLIHGRWSYQRVSILILYSFYKNMAFSLTQFWFAIVSLFTGQPLFESFFIALYNVFFTSMPIMMIAVFDQDVSARAVNAFPILYRPGQEKKSFNVKLFWLWLLTGVYHSACVFWATYFIFQSATLQKSGHGTGLWQLGTFAYTCIVLTVNLKIAIHTSYWTFYNHFFTWGSIALWFIFVSIYANFEKLIPDAYKIVYTLYESPPFWIGIVLVPVACLLPDYTVKYVYRNYFCSPVHIVKEIEKYGDLNAAVKLYYDKTEPAIVHPPEVKSPTQANMSKFGGKPGNDDDYYTYESYSVYTYEYDSYYSD